MSVLDRIFSRAQEVEGDEEIEIILPPAEQEELTSDVNHWHSKFLEQWDITIKGMRAERTYATIKGTLRWKHPEGRPLTKDEIAAECNLQPGSIEKYIRLYDFEAAYDAARGVQDFIVTLPNGDGRLTLTPSRRQVVAHHSTLKRRISSMLDRIDARDYSSLVASEGRPR